MSLLLAEGLPTWSAILIALGGSAVGGVAGSVWTTWRQIRHEREEKWRTRLLDAADEFATAFLQAHSALRDAVIHPEDVTLRDHFAAHEVEAQRRVDGGHERVARVTLLFGYDSAAQVTAGEASQAQHSALQELRRNCDESRARELIAKGLAWLEKFTIVANEAAQTPLKYVPFDPVEHGLTPVASPMEIESDTA